MQPVKREEMETIQKLVGDISEQDLRYVDCYIAQNTGIFIPSVGFCSYALRHQHTHPSYSFVVFFSIEQGFFPVQIELLPDHYLAMAMSPDLPHEEEEEDEFTRYVALFISKELFESVYAKYSDNPPEQYFWKQFQAEPEIMTYLKKFMAESENKLAGCRDVLDSLGTIITHQLIRNLLQINNPEKYITEKFEIERTIEFMHQSFGDKLTIAELAKMVSMSESHFTRTFKQETGLAPMEFLIKLRLEKAKKLLRSGAKNITEVSLQCGFSSASHFSASFTKHLGITPSEYQHSYGE